MYILYLDNVSESAASSAGGRMLLQRAFHDVLSRGGQITGVAPSDMAHVSTGPVCMASAFLARGKDIPFADFLGCVGSAQRSSLRFPYWNPEACKVDHN